MIGCWQSSRLHSAAPRLSYWTSAIDYVPLPFRRSSSPCTSATTHQSILTCHLAHQTLCTALHSSSPLHYSASTVPRCSQSGTIWCHSSPLRRTFSTYRNAKPKQTDDRAEPNQTAMQLRTITQLNSPHHNVTKLNSTQLNCDRIAPYQTSLHRTHQTSLRRTPPHP